MAGLLFSPLLLCTGGFVQLLSRWREQPLQQNIPGQHCRSIKVAQMLWYWLGGLQSTSLYSLGHRVRSVICEGSTHCMANTGGFRATVVSGVGRISGRPRLKLATSFCLPASQTNLELLTTDLGRKAGAQHSKVKIRKPKTARFNNFIPPTSAPLLSGC